MIKIRYFLCGLSLATCFVNNATFAQDIKKNEKRYNNQQEVDVFGEDDAFFDSPVLKKKIVLEEMSPAKKMLIKLSNPLLRAYIYLVFKYRACKSFVYNQWKKFAGYFFTTKQV